MEVQHASALTLLMVWAQWFLAPLVALGISAVYFLTCSRDLPVGTRLAASAHGVVIAVLYALAMLVALSRHSRPELGTPFSLLLVVPLLLILAALFLYRGRKLVHLLQVPNLLCLGWTAFIGGMAVTGNWL